MTKRDEFPAKVRDRAYERSKGHCENKACGLPLQIGHFAYDHILPDALGGKPELANCQVLCEACHSAKTGKQDVPRIRKADRQRRNHIGAKAESQRPLHSANTLKAPERPSKIGRAKIDKSVFAPLENQSPIARAWRESQKEQAQ